MKDQELLALLETALRASANAEQHHGSTWTRAAWVAMTIARYELITTMRAGERETPETDPTEAASQDRSRRRHARRRTARRRSK